MALWDDPIPEPVLHSRRIRELLLDVAERARADVMEVHEPLAQALFETTAEALEGLARAYAHYEEGTALALKG